MRTPEEHGKKERRGGSDCEREGTILQTKKGENPGSRQIHLQPKQLAPSREKRRKKCVCRARVWKKEKMPLAPRKKKKRRDREPL